MRTAVTVLDGVEFTMRDGCVLRATVYRPAEQGRYPALLVRTPYGRDSPGSAMALDPLMAARAGYVVVCQDSRGRFESEGSFDPYRDDINDGYDSIEHVASLPYVNGRVGIYGISYMGATALRGAVAAPPSLAAVASTQAIDDLYGDLMWRGGAFQWGQHLFWSLRLLAIPELIRKYRGTAELSGRLDALVGDIDRYDELISFRPPIEVPSADPQDPFFPYVYDVMKHSSDDGYYRERGTGHSHDRVAAPGLVIAGWFDLMLASDLSFWRGIREHGATAEVRSASRLIIGPWTHGVGISSSTQGDLDFGLRSTGASLDMKTNLNEVQLNWFGQWLRDETPVDEPPVKLFVMGSNRWRDEDDWPLARARKTPWHLWPNRQLAVEPPPTDGEPLHYLFDPSSPCPTLGGGLIMPANYPRGPVDQTPILGRRDVLEFTSTSLESALEVTGPVRAVLFVSSTAPDTDWVVKLCDVHPDGRTLNVCDGILRMSSQVDATATSPGQIGSPRRCEIDLWSTSHVFLAGHRIRLLVTSSDFPRYDVNPNTGDLGVHAQAFAIAHQRVFCDSSRPSHVLLPIVDL